MRNSRLPQSGGNLFQTIKAWCVEAESKGQKLIKLSIGQPSGPAFEMARAACATRVMSTEECVHEYQWQPRRRSVRAALRAVPR